MALKIKAERIGNIWIGGIEGHPEVAERALSKEAAEEKARRVAYMIERSKCNRSGGEHADPTNRHRSS